MTERLTNKELHETATLGTLNEWTLSKAQACVLAREVQDWRRLVNGGPCLACDGRGTIDRTVRARHVTVYQADLCRDCGGTGRTTGLIERLEAAREHVGSSWIKDMRRDIDNVLNGLRKMTS